MAPRPVFSPRRDELALDKKGAFSQRVITYLENITEATNEAPQDIEDDVVASLGGESQAGIAMAQGVETEKSLQDALNIIAQMQSGDGVLDSMINELEKPITDIFNIVSGLAGSIGVLISENSSIKKEIEDLKQLHGGL